MNAPNGSEGTRDALPPASPVPERSNVKPAPLESENGQRLAGRACSHFVPFKMIEQKATSVFENGVLYIIQENGEKYKAGPINGLVCCEIYSQPCSDQGVSESYQNIVEERK